MTTPITDAEAEELERLITGLRYDVRHGNAGVCGPGLLAAADGLERLLAYRRASQRAVEAAREALETTAKRATVQELHELGVVVNFNDAADKEILAARAAIAALDGRAGREAK